MANATGALQAATQATADIPILGTSITDYGTALNVKDWTGKTGTNVSGTSDLAPIEQQEDMILELYPDIAPVTVENFQKLVSEKFYDNLIFHRVIESFYDSRRRPTRYWNGRK